MNPEVQVKLDGYPEQARNQLLHMRQLIFDVANQSGLSGVEETLKWGEASYLVKGGSTIRMDWKPKDPEVIKLYFHCQTCLIETFKEIYPNDLVYEGKRAVVISLAAHVEQGPLRHCIEMALKYHSLKHLPLLGN